MFEATAIWVEEHVYPEINDYLNYVAGLRRAARGRRSPTARRRGA